MNVFSTFFEGFATISAAFEAGAGFGSEGIILLNISRSLVFAMAARNAAGFRSMSYSGLSCMKGGTLFAGAGSILAGSFGVGLVAKGAAAHRLFRASCLACGNLAEVAVT